MTILLTAHRDDAKAPSSFPNTPDLSPRSVIMDPFRSQAARLIYIPQDIPRMQHACHPVKQYISVIVTDLSEF